VAGVAVFQLDMPNTRQILSGAPLQFLSAQRSKTRSGRCVQRISGKQLGSRSELQFFGVGELIELTEVKMHFFTWEAWQSNQQLRFDQGSQHNENMVTWPCH